MFFLHLIEYLGLCMFVCLFPFVCTNTKRHKQWFIPCCLTQFYVTVKISGPVVQPSFLTLIFSSILAKEVKKIPGEEDIITRRHVSTFSSVTRLRN